MNEPILEYSRLNRSDLEAKGINWQSLVNFTSELRVAIEEARHRNKNFEEEAPFTDSGFFYPGGWIGCYNISDSIVRVISRLPPEEWEVIRNDIIGWLGLTSAPLFDSFLRRVTQQQLQRSNLLLAYSRFLILLTENLLAQPLPRTSIETKFIGEDIRGRLRYPETIRQETSHPNHYVSAKLHLLTVSPAVLLLVQFHAELAGELKRIRSESLLFQREISWRLSYHLSFLTSKPFNELLDHVSTSSGKVELLESARAATLREPLQREIFELYSDFLSRKSLLFGDIARAFDSAIKPMSKVYELWSLRVLLNTLQEELSSAQVKDFPFSLHFAEEKVLHYDGGSDDIKSLLRISPRLAQVGIPIPHPRPDFVFVKGKQAVLLADSKYKLRLSTMKLEDLQRLFSYLLDFQPLKHRVGLIFHLDESVAVHEKVEREDITIHFIRLRPNCLKDSILSLRSILYEVGFLNQMEATRSHN